VAQLEGKHKAAAAALEEARRGARGTAGAGASQGRALKKAEEQLASAEVGGAAFCCACCAGAWVAVN
jgi:hypothetical protein